MFKSVLCLALLVAPFHPVDKPQAKSDLDLLQGEWKMESLRVSGEQVPDDFVKSATLTVEKERYKLKLGDRNVVLSFQLDPAKSPKQIDLKTLEGAAKNAEHQGIYKLEGDTFTMCRNEAGKPARPKSFEAGADSGLTLVVWKRVKK